MTANLDKQPMPPLPEVWMVDWIASKTGQHYWQWNTSERGAKVCADQLADATPPMIGRITRLYPHPDLARSALVAALKDSLDFVQRYSHRWDTTTEDFSKHPQVIVDNAIAALLAAGEGLDETGGCR